jgi:hypothetical protein
MPPSAPVLSEEDDPPYQPTAPNLQTYETAVTHTLPSRSHPSQPPPSSTPTTATTSNQPPTHPDFDAAPTYSPTPPQLAHLPPTEDKQELQRRRLEMERSAPGEASDDNAETSTAQQSVLAPSAPVLDEDEDEDFGQRHQEQHGELPQYER